LTTFKIVRGRLALFLQLKVVGPPMFTEGFGPSNHNISPVQFAFAHIKSCDEGNALMRLMIELSVALLIFVEQWLRQKS
jgi:hypothetical protein